MVSLLVQIVEHLDIGFDDFPQTSVGITNFLIPETLFFAYR